MSTPFLFVCLALLNSSYALSPKVSVSHSGASSKDVVARDVLSAGTKFLITSFPNLRQVAYTVLPDNVWRPLVLGDIVSSPTALAVDSQAMRLYVADPPNSIVWVFSLIISSGFLRTVGQGRAALEGVSAHWLSLNGDGDLYFVGHKVDSKSANSTDNKTSLLSAANSTTPDSIWRHDAEKLANGDTFNPVEVYSRSNTDSRAWQVSGLAVDSFHIFWGNQADGSVHGSLCKGSRQNIGLSASSMVIKTLNSALNEVRGVTTTGTEIYFLSPQGVYGYHKSSETEVSDPTQGLVAKPPASNKTWSPMSIAWDGHSLLYFTDIATGAIYSVPSVSLREQNMTKFADAPYSHGMAVLVGAKHKGQKRGSNNAISVQGRLPTLLLLVLAGLRLATPAA
eukprot:TRINITY_DN46395_c0_g1_i1.p1 TRINITY_DN46395_c0_g1~~TRINITY_DN46395_c0_g1_i1.p1  ORF type:complete len:434 (-),score=50.83 TRINITY_DN46395_c0_g1_i1:219-1403(-)